MHCFANFRTNLGKVVRISQDIYYVRMTDNAVILTKYGHCTNLLNNNEMNINYLPPLSEESSKITKEQQSNDKISQATTWPFLMPLMVTVKLLTKKQK